MDRVETLEIPRLRSLARHALPHLIEATLIPLALFYVAMALVGVWGALGAALVWSYGALGWRVVTGRRIPGVLALGALLLTGRTVIALATDSVFVYFLQPSLGSLLVAGAFLVSVPVGQPLAARLALDFFPVPGAVMARPFIRQVFTRITLLWAFTHTANATVSIWLLASQPVSTYVVAKQGVSLTATITGVVLSTLLFKQAMRTHNVRLSFRDIA